MIYHHLHLITCFVVDFLILLVIYASHDFLRNTTYPLPHFIFHFDEASLLETSVSLLVSSAVSYSYLAFYTSFNIA